MNRKTMNEAGKCTWHAWQEGKTYAFPEEVLYGDLTDYDATEQRKLIAAGFTDSDRVNVIFPKGSVFTVKSMHGPGGGNPVIEFYKLPDMEFDVYCEDFDDTLYSIVESRTSASESNLLKDIQKILND